MTCPWRGIECNAAEGTCTARWATGNASHPAGSICGEPATEWVGDSPVCHHHYERAMDWYHKYRADLPERVRQQVEEAERLADERARMAAEARSIVYFLRRADGMIKIGVTTDYKGRLSSLQSEHGKLQLLLAYAGTRREEREAHTRFALCRDRGEWFRPELRLLLAIQQLRNGRAEQKSSLPEQVTIMEIKAMIKAVRYPEAEAS